MRQDLWTRWGRDLDPAHVLQDYPRPQLVRDSYLNLNGWWDHAVTSASDPPPSSYDGRILVPFSPEAPLSGVRRALQPHERLTYRREVEVPDGFVPAGGRLLLHFGAVDQTCVVRFNGAEVGRNAGGYLPFSCDLTEVVRAGPNELVVDVRDRSDGHQHATGKQRLRRGGIWYTAQSGIWQTVWLEAVPAVHVERLTLVPLLTDGAVDVTVHADRATEVEARVTVGATSVAAPVGSPVRVRLDDVRPWSPEDPYLYDVEVVLGEDRVTSYVGLRSYGVGPDAHGMPRLLLNGAPVLQVGVLDQGYWPDGLLTAPADAAMVHDIETMKGLGFTMLRKHLKVEPLRWYHHCDRLGMLVWQDFVNGGGRYRTAAVTWPGRYPVRLDDTRRHALLGRASAAGRDLFREESRRTVEHLHNVPSISTWVIFNEGWGQFDANAVTEEVRLLDPTRVLDHASGWHDQGGGDLRSLHDYGRRPRMTGRRRGRRHDGRVLVLSEYGGRGRRITGHTYDTETAFGYGDRLDAEALAEWFAAVHALLADAVRDGLSATVYTQLCDVEDELNGLLTYDREVLKLDVGLVRRTLDRLRASLPATPPRDSRAADM